MHATRFLLVLFVIFSTAMAETVQDRKGAILNDRAVMEKDARWIYNDFERGFRLAREQNKPLLAVLRCVPCLACAGIDAEVLSQDSGLESLLDQFVCVRIINANQLDLARFQFDYDLSFSTLFFNGDGTLYGRFGSWTHQKNPKEKTVAGYRRAMEATLVLHRGYPQNKASLKAKQGQPLPFKSPLGFPELSGRYQPELDWNDKIVQSCVHCHQIGDALRSYHRKQDPVLPKEWIYPWPAPETIGLALAPDHVARIESVAPGSIAAKAGLQAGDDLLAWAGQPLISPADVSWCLHQASDARVEEVSVNRGGERKLIRMKLAAGWRDQTDISRRVGTWPLRALAFGGMLLEDLSDEARAERGLGTESTAILVKHVGQYGEHAAAKKAGFLNNDIILALDGVSGRVTESQLIGRILTVHRPGDRIGATVLREGKRLQLEMPVQ